MIKLSENYKQETAPIPQKPQAPVVETDNIPTELKNTDRWVLWSFKEADGKWTKVPILRSDKGFFPTDTQNPRNHRRLNEVLAEYHKFKENPPTEGEDLYAAGVGFVLSDADNIIGLDCDNCINEIDEEGAVDMTISGEAFYEFWEVRGAYIEISPSGKGLRAFVRGKLPENMKLKTGVTVEENTCTWEVYDSKRYFTVTGDCMNEVEQLPLVSDEDWANYRDQYMGTRSLSSIEQDLDLDCTPEPLNELDQRKLSKARKDESELVGRLDGSLIDNGDPSTRDHRMICSLAKIFPEHPGKVHQIWRDSLAWREKCEDRPDYVERTLLSAYASIPENPFTNLGEEESQNELEAWETPEEIHLVSKPAPFPIDALPELMRNAVVEVAERIQAPTEMVVAHALTVLSTAVQGQYDVIRDTQFQGGNKLRSPVSLFVLTILDSGERKSTSSLFKGKLREHEKSLKASKSKEFAHYDAQKDVYSKKRDTLLAEIRRQTKAREDTSECERRLEELEQPKGPVIPKWSYEDMTMEGLLKSMKDWPVAVLETDEAGSIFGGYSMSSDHSMKTFAQLNKLWSGDRVKITRGDVTKEAELDGARLTVGLSLQPSVLQKFMDSQGEQAEGSGFLARFLVSAPESLMGTRFYEETRKAWFGLAAFNEKILKLLNQTVKTRTDRRRKPKVMTLTPEAMNIWIEYHNSVEAQIAEGGKYRDVKSTAAKSAENAARIAALFEILDGSSSNQETKLDHIDFSEPESVESGADTDSVDNEPEGPKVGETQMVAGVRLAQWYLDEAQRYQTKVLVPKEIQNAWKLDAWLLRRCREKHVDYFPKNEVLQGGPGSMRKCEQLQAALNILKDHHRIQTVPKGPTPGKKAWIHLNPALIPNSQDLQ